MFKSHIDKDGYYSFFKQSIDEDVEKLKPCALADGNINDSLSKIVCMVVPQKLKHRITMWPSNFTSRHIPKSVESNKWKRCS